MGQLLDKRCLIVGGTTGLGRAAARRFVEEGARVVVAGLEASAAAAAAPFVACDVTDPAQVLQKLMRHRNIKTTMDYYANVDEAVMDAVLGVQRNTSRNSTPVPHPEGSAESGRAST